MFKCLMSNYHCTKLIEVIHDFINSIILYIPRKFLNKHRPHQPAFPIIRPFHSYFPNLPSHPAMTVYTICRGCIKGKVHSQCCFEKNAATGIKNHNSARVFTSSIIKRAFNASSENTAAKAVNNKLTLTR